MIPFVNLLLFIDQSLTRHFPSLPFPSSTLSSSMTTEFTNNENATQLNLLPEEQATSNEDDQINQDDGNQARSDAEDHGDTAEAEVVVPNPFTRADAGRLVDVDQISFTIPDTFTYIADGMGVGDGVFTPFRSLETVIIPKSITSIGARSFQFCSALASTKFNNVLRSCRLGHGS